MESALTRFWQEAQSWKHNLDVVITKPQVVPGDVKWDSLLPPNPVYVLVVAYVLFSLSAWPPLYRYRPSYPLHAVFFAFNVFTLVANFCLFMNALLIFHAKGSLWLQLLTLVVDRDGDIVVNLTWIRCAMKFFEFLGGALMIMRGKHDNFRSIRITYFQIHLLNIWIVLRQGAPPFFSLVTLCNIIFGLVLGMYGNFEPSLHMNNPELLTKIERTVCALEVGQLTYILHQLTSLSKVVEEVTTPADSRFSQGFRMWMLSYCSLAVLMLTIIGWKADVYIRDATTRMRQARSKVAFSDYPYQPSHRGQSQEE